MDIVQTGESRVFVGPGVETTTPRKLWTACQHPERPPDGNVMYHLVPKCRACDTAWEANRRLRILEVS